MSYLLSPRLSFSGRFLSDVSTINNENDGGDPGWNPQGGGAFELLKCSVSGGWHLSEALSDDPALSYMVSGRPDGSSAKMVDLDPDWQMSSQLWALWVRVFDPKSGELALIGKYTVSSFRDIWMRQCPETVAQQPLPNGQPMGARYVSTLTDVTWGPAATRSPLLTELHRTSPTRLSIGFHQFGYFYATNHARYRTGTLIGAIGPSQQGDAETVLARRRLQAVPLNAKLPCLGPIDFEVSPDQSTIGLDLGHALPIANVDGDIQDLGKWQALPQLSECVALTLGVAQSDFAQWKVPAQPVQVLGEINSFVPHWYTTSGGVVSFSISQEGRKRLSQPLALYGRKANRDMIAITQEVIDGLLVRADSFVFRMEPGTKAEAVLHATKFGMPASNVTLYLTPQTPVIPPALNFPQSVVTDSTGKATVPLIASDPGSPRQSPNPGHPAPDGQVYIIAYSPHKPGVNGAIREGTGLSSLDVIAVHVRQHLDVPAMPTWEDDVMPVFAGYAALYPIMSKHLFDLADYNTIVAHRVMLRHAFSRDINDPNYMPVTRDLSDSKRAIILKWLRSETGDATTPLRRRAQVQLPSTGIAPLVAARAPGTDDPDNKRDNVAAFQPPVATNRREGSNDQS